MRSWRPRGSVAFAPVVGSNRGPAETTSRVPSVIARPPWAHPGRAESPVQPGRGCRGRRRSAAGAPPPLGDPSLSRRSSGPTEAPPKGQTSPRRVPSVPARPPWAHPGRAESPVQPGRGCRGRRESAAGAPPPLGDPSLSRRSSGPTEAPPKGQGQLASRPQRARASAVGAPWPGRIARPARQPLPGSAKIRRRCAPFLCPAYPQPTPTKQDPQPSRQTTSMPTLPRPPPSEKLGKTFLSFFTTKKKETKKKRVKKAYTYSSTHALSTSFDIAQKKQKARLCGKLLNR